MPKWLAAGMALALGACALAPESPARRDLMVRQVADDAATFNQAYSQAVNGQILLNILRSRDRQPRYYLSTTGISAAPTLGSAGGASLGGLGLGRAFDPWGVGSISISRDTQNRPSYAVQPLGADVLIKAAFLPTPNNVFAHYWESGWPRDLLLLVMVHKIIRESAGRSEEFTNEANDIRDDCPAFVQSRGCAFAGAMRAMISAIGDQPAAIAPANAPMLCGLIDAYGPVTPVRAREPQKGETCPARFVVGKTTYVLELRSFDDMVYYIGELMRRSFTDANGDPDAALQAHIKVQVAGLRGGGGGVPLFRIVPEREAEAAVGRPAWRGFAANVEYRGRRYYAGQAVGRSCADAAASGLCADDAQHGDRSSSVLSLLAELLALNQSPDAIRAPSRVFAE